MGTRNDVIAAIVVSLTVVLVIVAYGIWRLLTRVNLTSIADTESLDADEGGSVIVDTAIPAGGDVPPRPPRPVGRVPAPGGARPPALAGRPVPGYAAVGQQQGRPGMPAPAALAAGLAAASAAAYPARMDRRSRTSSAGLVRKGADFAVRRMDYALQREEMLREEVVMQAPRGITDVGDPPSESSSERTRRARKGKRRR